LKGARIEQEKLTEGLAEPRQSGRARKAPIRFENA
jgi:hypothetical protein